ncbi:MAG: hypothetical protein JXR94_18100 [Candidatus Hydrogenedentes bacterium]|nr:hypothetical protein [Candidatus Hydrogenedentota bacterium]
MNGESTRRPDGASRALLRGYLLDTLSARARSGLEQRLAESAEWRAALDAERAALDALDRLPAEQPSRDLAAAVMHRLDEARAPRRATAGRRAIEYGLAAAAVVIVAVLVLPALSRSREAACRATVQTNLKQVGMALKMYANESRGELLPPLAPYNGVWTLDVRVLYPEYLTDLSLLVNPSLPDADALVDEIQRAGAQTPPDWEAIARITAQSYVYTGWAVRDASEVQVLARRETEIRRPDAPTDLRTDGEPLYRLREGIERFMITDINNPAATAYGQSEMPVVFETGLGKDGAEGRHVLFMDGHVDFIESDADSPVLRAVDELLAPRTPYVPAPGQAP